ncbi:hypothetical protein D9M71_563240 [compost metagenome]
MQAGLAGDAAAGVQQGLDHVGMAPGVRRFFQRAAGGAGRVAGDVDGVFHHHRPARAAQFEPLDHYRHLHHPLAFLLVLGPSPVRGADRVNLKSEKLREMSIELSPEK